MLKAGIDVYSTVNVQHLESLNDIVASITGIAVRERIPDSVFDEADQVELVDLEPQELIQRLEPRSGLPTGAGAESAQQLLYRGKSDGAAGNRTAADGGPRDADHGKGQAAGIGLLYG